MMYDFFGLLLAAQFSIYVWFLFIVHHHELVGYSLNGSLKLSTHIVTKVDSIATVTCCCWSLNSSISLSPMSSSSPTVNRPATSSSDSCSITIKI